MKSVLPFLTLLLVLTVLNVFVLPAIAQVPSPSPVASASPASVVSPAPAVVAPASAPSKSSLIGVIVAAVACLNVGLSALQQIFSKLSKSEPGWLKSLSVGLLAVAKYLGSNPNV